jgi:hypothetical protein
MSAQGHGDGIDRIPLRGDSVKSPVKPGRATDGPGNSDLRRYGLDRLYGILDRLYEVELGPPDLGAGPCGECGEQSRSRWRLGHYELCHHCRRLRAKALGGESGPTYPRQERDWAIQVPAPSPPSLDDALMGQVEELDRPESDDPWRE